MRLSDIMSAMRLERYAEVALLLFMAAFVGVGVQLWRRNRKDWEPLSRLPLDEADASQNQHETRSGQ